MKQFVLYGATAFEIGFKNAVNMIWLDTWIYASNYSSLPFSIDPEKIRNENNLRTFLLTVFLHRNIFLELLH